MSGEEEDGLIRTVTKPYRSRTNQEMNIIGMLYFLGLIMILIPLLPFLFVIWIAMKLNAAITRAAGPG